MQIDKEQTCCFTGHRNISAAELPVIKQRTREYITHLISHGVRHFIVGGAVGYDTYAAQLLFDMRESEYPEIRVTLAYPFDGFTSSWTDEQRQIYAKLLPMYNDVVRVSPKGGRAVYLQRDRYMVDHSQYCISFCKRKTGGTAYTIRYALENVKIVYNTANFDFKQG